MQLQQQYGRVETATIFAIIIGTKTSFYTDTHSVCLWPHDIDVDVMSHHVLGSIVMRHNELTN